ncbi:hypothetical protein [Streptomyces jumonjinensis]|uniref:Uncharacterized protein n=1 Tax=Streptomyces jumonjinensis TaxID=1945 RepID=A0A646KS79_STRJU|nr:hypothetical protein [Streptomyces jumonjinensis]MQT05184.1 hypothetical protein [Streptomyces jumonjinensis]
MRQDSGCCWSAWPGRSRPVPAGAESSSNASGHTHRTGSQYVESFTNTGGNLVVEWRADNDGGGDDGTDNGRGDGGTWGDCYGTRVC